jgi:hypothetical protein
MATIDDQQIDKMMDDIASIKTVINQSKPVLQKILMPRHFRILSLIVGISIILFSLVFYYAIGRFGSYEAIPQNFKNSFFGLMVLDFMLLTVLKYFFWDRSLKKMDRAFDIPRAMEAFFSFRIVHVYLPLVAVMVIVCVYLSRIDAYYIIPTLAIGKGLMYNFIGSVTKIRQWLIAGYWFLISGVVLLDGDLMPATVSLAVALGIGHLLFAAIPNRVR